MTAMTKNQPVNAKKRKNALEKNTAFDHVNHVLLIIFSLVMLIPFYHCVVLAFSDGSDLTWNGISFFWPRVFSFDSFKKVFDDSEFFLAARNSIVRTVAGALISSLVTSGFAFALSHNELKFRKVFTFMGLVCMYFSGGMIPTFLQIRDLGLYDTFWAYLIPMSFNMFNCMVFLSYFRGIPRDLEESAVIDGANELIMFFRIMIPVAMPVFACVLLFDAVAHWNAYFDCMIYTKSDNLVVLSYKFAKMLLTQQYLDVVAADPNLMSPEELMMARGPVSSLTLQMATMVVTVIPILCVYPFLQKYFVKGIMVGSLKG
ncbi:MAG: carbohydrate ABC transporter permease [Clostridiales bacterium]|nr:carbohydrate ABC transporter permease [Clostridiales bacterium]